VRPSDGGTIPPARVAWRAFARDRSAVGGGIILLLLAVMAIFADNIAPYDPRTFLDPIRLKNVAPSLDFPFGTDQFSRDVLSRVIYGARVSLAVSFLSVIAAATVGTAYGAIAGYIGGWIDSAMMRFVDALLAIPRVLLLIAVATLWGEVNVIGLVVLLGVTGWFGVSRLVRSLVISASEGEFVTAARALGAGHIRILALHILPHVTSPVLVAATLAIGNVVVIESGLTFLGMGVPHNTPSWGGLFRDGMDAYTSHWWVPLFTGVALVVTVLGANLVAAGLRQALSARQLPAR